MDKETRDKMEEKLIDARLEEVINWALRDREELRNYILNAERLESHDDEALESIYETEFGHPFDEKH